MLEFKNPPAKRTSGGAPPKFMEEAAALRERPGEWALLLNGAPSTASRIASGGYAAFPAGDFEAVARKSDRGRSDIYVRYIGGAL